MATPSEELLAKNNQTTAYNLTPEVLGQLIAAHTSGLIGAFAEQDDIDLAKHLIHLIDTRYD